MTIRGVFKGTRQTRSLAAGEVLFEVGDEGHEMFGVISGLIELRRGTHVVQRVGADGTFGELAIVDAEPRALSAVAIEPSEVAVIGRHDFLFLVHETPTFALDVMRSMSHLIRDLSARS